MFERIVQWIEVKVTYDIVKSAGVNGFMALVSFGLIVWQWDTIFYPLLDKLLIIDILQKGGLLGTGGFHYIQSAINIIVFFLFICISVSLISIIPAALLHSALSLTGNDNNIFKKTFLFIMFLPVVVIFMPVYIAVRRLKTLRGNTPNDLIAYVHANEKLRHAYYGKEKQGLLSSANRIQPEHYMRIMASQDNFLYEEITVEDAIAELNISVKSLLECKSRIVGYNKRNDLWVMLYPTQIPAFASELVLNNDAEKSPLNYKHYATNLASRDVFGKSYIEFNFVVPAVAIKPRYNYDTRKMECVAPTDNCSYFVTVNDLDVLVRVDGTTMDAMYYYGTQKSTLVSNHMQTVETSYLIPIVYRNELESHLYNYKSNYYYQAEKVANYFDNGEYFQPVVMQALESKIKRGFKWAMESKELIEKERQEYAQSH